MMSVLSAIPARIPSSTGIHPRLESVDVVRGVIMIIMALDHTREFFHVGAMSFQPDDLTRTTAALFLTRWVTHVCAPVFFFTTGVGAFFWRGRGHRESQVGFLVKRGLWLVLLEMTALRFATSFSLRNGPVFLTILWALGWSMVALAFLSRLPIRLLAGGCLLVILLHNLADPISAQSLGAAGRFGTFFINPD